MADKINVPRTVRAGKTTIYYTSSFARQINSNIGLIQKFIDKQVGTNLQMYVSRKIGTQEMSIPDSKTYGKGYVLINVPYAEYQAYSPKIKKRVGKRGTRPFERMKEDKKDTILRQTCVYARRLNGGR